MCYLNIIFHYEQKVITVISNSPNFKTYYNHTGVTLMSDLLYMMTFSGNKFYPKKPTPLSVDIVDIARSL